MIPGDHMPGPIAPESNPPINPQYYQPSRFVISAINPGDTTTVTMIPSTTGGTTVYPNYVVGQLIRMLIPPPYSIQQINDQQAYVIEILSSTQVVVDIDSRFYDPFIPSPANTSQSPQIVAIGDINTGDINTSGRINQATYIPGSFIDISPA